MQTVSNEYKQVMSQPLRNHFYISVGIGVINQEAQASGAFSENYQYARWSNLNVPFQKREVTQTYATMEQNFFKADGSMIFLPDDNELAQYVLSGVTTEDILGAVRIDFDNIYDIKGLTVDFTENYPTKFTVQTASKTMTFENKKQRFITTNVLGETNYIIITPLSMVGGNQRLRINSILMGVGLDFTNNEVESASFKEFCSTVSAELPSKDMSLSVLDYSGDFDVDNAEAYINYLETKQTCTASIGVELNDKSVEWIDIGIFRLDNWSYQKGKVKFNAKNIFSFMDDEYSLGNRIYTRTAYDEALSILTDAGLEPDEYEIDEYLMDVILENPMPIGTHKECLQILANACRCVLYESIDGRIVIRASFAYVIDPEDIVVESTGDAPWSKSENVIEGDNILYADMTRNFFKADGSLFFLPETANYLKTGYVSNEVADDFGLFRQNPTISLILPAAYVYYGIHVNFKGNPPKKIVIHTYKYGKPVEDVEFTDCKEENWFSYEFKQFNKITIEVKEGAPNDRVVIDKMSFGNLSDYKLTRDNMLSEPTGYHEKKVKDLFIKIYSYQNNEDGEPEEIEDRVFYKLPINSTGENIVCNNPLVHTEEHAEQIAEWMGVYYANNISYKSKYRGEPRMSATDIITMESEFLNNLQVQVEQCDLSFNGGLTGNLELRRLIRMVKNQ